MAKSYKLSDRRDPRLTAWMGDSHGMDGENDETFPQIVRMLYADGMDKDDLIQLTNHAILYAKDSIDRTKKRLVALKLYLTEQKLALKEIRGLPND